MASTISEGLSVRGTRKEGWEDPNSGARNSMHARGTTLTVKDIVDNMLKK